MTETTDLSAVIAERRARIGQDAPCEGCGATEAFCASQRGKDPTAPPWFGCCARGALLDIPCLHRVDRTAQDALLNEIEAGTVRTVAEIDAEEAERKARRVAARGPLGDESKFDQGEWWRMKTGEWIRIADMAPSHRANTARMLLRGVRHHALDYSVRESMQTISMLSGPLGPSDDAADGIARELLAAEDRRMADPVGWLTGTALYRALTDGTPEGEARRTAEVEQAVRELKPVCEIPDCGCSGEAHP